MQTLLRQFSSEVIHVYTQLYDHVFTEHLHAVSCSDDPAFAHDATSTVVTKSQGDETNLPRPGVWSCLTAANDVRKLRTYT